MAFIRKDVNFTLLLLIIIILGAVAGLTTYYQSTYKNLSITFENKLSDITQLSQNLSTTYSTLNKTSEELRLETTDKERLNQLYNDLSNQFTQLKDELSITIVNLKQTEESLANTKLELQGVKVELSETKSELNNVKRSRDDYKNLSTYYCSKLQGSGQTC